MYNVPHISESPCNIKQHPVYVITSKIYHNESSVDEVIVDILCICLNSNFVMYHYPLYVSVLNYQISLVLRIIHIYSIISIAVTSVSIITIILII